MTTTPEKVSETCERISKAIIGEFGKHPEDKQALVSGMVTYAGFLAAFYRADGSNWDNMKEPIMEVLKAGFEAGVAIKDE